MRMFKISQVSVGSEPRTIINRVRTKEAVQREGNWQVEEDKSSQQEISSIQVLRFVSKMRRVTFVSLSELYSRSPVQKGGKGKKGVDGI